MRRLALSLLLVTGLAEAQIDYGHNPPVTHAAIEFAADFPALIDSEWGIPLGGFGGTRRGEDPGHAPVIFVHGNNVDACDWKLVRDDFLTAGWSAQALWALSYNGLGNDVGNDPSRSDERCSDEHAARNGGDSVSRITGNNVNVPDLYAFIEAVRNYTGSRRFSLVSHSLGVTLARKTLQVHPELRQDLVAFVGIAGGNHGTSLCPPGSSGVLYSCDELEAGSDWLNDLNGPQGEDETYPPARWLTIYDGTGTGDVGYVPGYETSPRLEGADNQEFPNFSHNALRVDPDIVTQYRTFIEQAETSPPPIDSQQSVSGLLGPMTLLLLLITAVARANSKAKGLLALGALAISMPAVAAPLPAAADFPSDFTPPVDSELQFPLGGFGGERSQRPNQVPVIFVHGNTADACNWKLVRDDFLDAGWNRQSLWALSYHGLGSGRGQAPGRPDPRCLQEQAAAGGAVNITSNEVNVADLAAFIRAVQTYTGSRLFSLVSHSLGVTLARRTLQANPDLQGELVAFVGIAGGNHGTSLCPPGTESMFPGCAELASSGSPWLDALNGPEGLRETYPSARWLTIYDGSGNADLVYRPPLEHSPALKGAKNLSLPGTSHNDLRVRPDIVERYREFLENAARDRQRRRALIGK